MKYKYIIVFSITILILLSAFTIKSIAKSEEIDVYVIAGQSNAAYYYPDINYVNDTVEKPIVDAYYYGTQARPVKLISDNVYSDSLFGLYDAYSTKWNIGNIEASFMKTMTDFNERKIVTINVGIEGSTIHDLNNRFEDIAHVIDAALKLLSKEYKVCVKGVLWIQGESDSETLVDDYISEFKKTMNYYSKYGNMKYYIAKTRNYVNSAIAQEELAQMYDNVYITNKTYEFTMENGCILGDSVHFTQVADVELGIEFAKMVYNFK